MQQPYSRRLSYATFQSIVPRLPYGKRMYLSKCSKMVRGIHKHVPIELKCLKFHQELRPSPGGVLKPEFSGLLDIEGIKWVFTFDENTDRVSIECLGKTIVTGKKTIAREYFHYFLQFRIEHLELKGCGDIFESGQKLKCHSMMWDFGNHYAYSWVNKLNPPSLRRPRHRPTQNHFDRFEMRFDEVRDNWWRPTVAEITKTFVVNGGRVLRHKEAEVMRKLYLFSWDMVRSVQQPEAVVQGTHRLNDIQTMFAYCDAQRYDIWSVGSFLRGIYEHLPGRQETLYRSLLKRYNRSKEIMLNGRKCIVLKLKPLSMIYVSYDYDPIRNEDVFTVQQEALDPEARKCAVIVRDAVIVGECQKEEEYARRAALKCDAAIPLHVIRVDACHCNEPVLKMQFATVEDAQLVMKNFEQVRRNLNGGMRVSVFADHEDAFRNFNCFSCSRWIKRWRR